MLKVQSEDFLEEDFFKNSQTSFDNTELDLEDVIDNCVEWIKALADSSYPRAVGYLFGSDGAMCCLGVGRAIVNNSARINNKSDKVLNEHQKDWLGLRCVGGAPAWFASDDLYPLTILNDDFNYSHPKIAGMILSQPHVYLKDEIAEGVLDYFFNH